MHNLGEGLAVQGCLQRKSKCLEINVSGHSSWKSLVTTERQQLSIFPHACLPPSGEIKHSHEKLQSSGRGMGYQYCYMTSRKKPLSKKKWDSGLTRRPWTCNWTTSENISIILPFIIVTFQKELYEPNGSARCLCGSTGVANKKKIRCGAWRRRTSTLSATHLSLNF